MAANRLCSWLLLLNTLLCSFCGDSGAAGGTAAGENGDIQLGMVANSAAYFFTQSEASDRLAIDYLPAERHRSQALDRAWECALQQKGDVPVLPAGLRKEHLLAVRAYTESNCSKFYREFNRAMRMYGANDSVYAEKFPFKSFHYLLSVALRRLRESSGRAPTTTYRGMRRLAVGQEGLRMRFGYFASSSRDRNVATKFGRSTFFVIDSKFGAPIEMYSRYPEEKEVLIPPYELFNVTRYVARNGRVNVSLTGVGVRGIPVKVERGAGGEMRVVRNEGAAISAVAGQYILALLCPISVYSLGKYFLSNCQEF